MEDSGNNDNPYKNFMINKKSYDEFDLRYMDDMGHYSNNFCIDGDFWKIHKKFFQGDFEIFMIILTRCLVTKDIDTVSYSISKCEENNMSIKISHESTIGMHFNITIELEEEIYKVKLLEEKISSMKEEIENLKRENKVLHSKNIYNERGIIIINPPETNREYSGVFEDIEGDNSIGFSQSCLDSFSCWSAKNNDKKQWMIIDLQEIKEIRGFINMARYNYSCKQQVIKLMFLISDDKKIWTNCGEFECKSVDEQNYVNSTFINPKRKIRFETPLRARYIKVVPTEWINHISMRFGLIIKGGDKI